MNILVIAPHPDDEILGVGGTMRKRAEEGHRVTVCVITKGCEPYYSTDMILETRGEQKCAHQLLGVSDCVYLDFPTIELDRIPFSAVVKKLEDVVKHIEPDEVYIPHYGDIHFEHRITYDAAMTALRPKKESPVKRILAYETISETGWDYECSAKTFMPNVYEKIDSYIDAKLCAMEKMKSQLQEFPSARSLNALLSLAKYRGATIGTNAAEAFALLREVR